MKTSAFNRIYAEAQRVNIQSSEWFNFAGFFWMQCSERQLQKMRELLRAQGCRTVQKDDGKWFALDKGILVKAN